MIRGANHIRHFCNAQIMVDIPGVNKPDVKVAIRRGKAPVPVLVRFHQFRGPNKISSPPEGIGKNGTRKVPQWRLEYFNNRNVKL